jgi:protein-S-isoprenylcysteine O-methyltransferase Ste14
MSIYPKITLTLINGFLLIIPLLILRFGVPALVHKAAMPKLDLFPPAEGFERIMMRIYFVTNTFLILSPILARIQPETRLAMLGWITYGVGLLLLAGSLFDFSKSSDGLVITGVYRFSRNPIYIAYFLILFGVACLIGSWTHLVLTVIYQVSTHWLILSEERWCERKFGQAFIDYRKKVHRYF